MTEKNILLLVEGEKTEKDFFLKYSDSLMGKANIKIVPFRCNIYALYSFMKEYDFNIDIVDALLLCKSVDEDDKERIRGKKFFRRFLVFDFDFQDTHFSREDKIRRINDLARFFDDDSEQGLLFINYPMFESVKEKFHIPPLTFCYKEETNYKGLAASRGNSMILKNLQYDDFMDLIRNSVGIEQSILSMDTEDRFTYDMLSKAWYSDDLLKRQIEQLNKENAIYCINTSVQLALVYFGLSLYQKL